MHLCGRSPCVAGVIPGNAWIAAAGVARARSIWPASGWDEDVDRRQRFEAAWVVPNIGQALGAEAASVDSPTAAAGALFVAQNCDMCSEVGVVSRHAGHRPDDHASRDPSDSFVDANGYEPPDGGRPEDGVAAVARALEQHLTRVGRSLVAFSGLRRAVQSTANCWSMRREGSRTAPQRRPARRGAERTAMKIAIPGGSGAGRDYARACVSSRRTRRRGAESPAGRVLARGRMDGVTVGAWLNELDGLRCRHQPAGRSVNCRYNAGNRQQILDSRVRSTRDRPRHLAIDRAAASLAAGEHATITRTASIAPTTSAPEKSAALNQCPATWRFSIDVWRVRGSRLSPTPPRPDTQGRSRSAIVMSPTGRGHVRHAAHPGAERSGWPG